MWTVLLVEDEVFVRRKVKETMPWKEMGFTIIGEAGNGLEAMERIREYQPDVVITDIVMPLMNGVELLKQARREGFTSRFVMLTVMSDFDNVQQALEFGATSYMLKLYMDHATLAETMSKVHKELLERRNAEIRDAEVVYRKLWKLMVGRVDSTDGLGSELLVPGVHGRDLSIIAVQHGLSAYTLDDFTALNLIENDMASAAVWHSLTIEGVSYLFMWLPATSQFSISTERNLPYSLIYTELKPATQLMDTWQSVLVALNEEWYNPTFSAKLCTSVSSPLRETADTWGLEYEIWHNLEQLRWEAVTGAVNELWGKFEVQNAPQQQVKQAAKRIVHLCERISQLTTSDEEVILAPDHINFKSAFLARLEAHFKHLSASRIPISDHPEINKIITYLHEHFAEEITLDTLAKLVCMDDKYVSGLFKKKLGVSIIHYLHQIRIEHAQRLLRETDRTISEIGERVGFANDNYFIKIFKRSTGGTPASFRNRI
ncbi:helix-turn-helix domain-containing protein [Paenibacillus qinlingensis]|uniref:helix-turn-helix domain-containing protein n=1 Tax=Paenibacillus qinlingensis TaxID=1837343 RepID=UPI001563D8B6|nr:helix-turn-helix domain-containing protein [Paenibacillus qinlingensis]NQX58264.1 response regulator [Paenibacillus qinlingensis]